MNLTPLDQDLVLHIAEYADERHYAPSHRELCAHFGWKSKATLHKRLVMLRDRGLVDWVDGESRTLHATDEGRNLDVPF